MIINQIFENNKKWAEEKIKLNNDYFQNLSKPQKPKVLYIGCSDSRVTAEEIMGLEPGDVFVHRNIANQVISTDLNSMSIIAYSVNILKIEEIIICGHYGCGGIKAAMEPKDLGIINPWLRHIRDIYRLHKDELDAIDSEEDRYNRFAEINTIEQAINVLKTPEVQRNIFNNKLRVHCWMFEIHSGKLIDLKFDYKNYLEEIMKIYRIV